MAISKFAVIIREALNRQVPVISGGARLLSLLVPQPYQYTGFLGVKWQQPKAGKITMAHCESWRKYCSRMSFPSWL